jgi:hypothetical protein
VEYFSAGLKLLRGEPCINLSLVYSRSRKNKLASDIASARALLNMGNGIKRQSPPPPPRALSALFLSLSQIFNSPVFIVQTMNN